MLTALLTVAGAEKLVKEGKAKYINYQAVMYVKSKEEMVKE